MQDDPLHPFRGWLDLPKEALWGLLLKLFLFLDNLPIIVRCSSCPLQVEECWDQGSQGLQWQFIHLHPMVQFRFPCQCRPKASLSIWECRKYRLQLFQIQPPWRRRWQYLGAGRGYFLQRLLSISAQVGSSSSPLKRCRSTSPRRARANVVFNVRWLFRPPSTLTRKCRQRFRCLLPSQEHRPSANTREAFWLLLRFRTTPGLPSVTTTTPPSTEPETG